MPLVPEPRRQSQADLRVPGQPVLHTYLFTNRMTGRMSRHIVNYPTLRRLRQENAKIKANTTLYC